MSEAYDWAANANGSYDDGIAALRERLERSKVVIGNCTLYNEDCRFILPTLGKVDAILTDPPYGIGYQRGAGGKESLNGRPCSRNDSSVDGDDCPFDPTPWLGYQHVILWGANHYAQRLPHGRWLAWDKLAGLASYDSYSDVEFAWRNGRGKDVIFSHLWKGVIRGSENNGQRRDHPTQKPIALMQWCIGHLPNDVKTILDPFMGSGTTLVACAKLGKRGIGIEHEKKYFDVACRRIEEAYRQPDLFIESQSEAIQDALL